MPGVRVSVELPLPPATLEGLNEAEAPVGKPLTLIATALEKPLAGVMVAVVVARALPAELTEDGLTATEKSGVGVVPLIVQLTCAVWLSEPLEPVMVMG